MIDYFRPEAEKEQPETIVFTGSMDWMANEDGIMFFIEKALPQARLKFPNATLALVGRNPSVRLKEIAEREKSVAMTGMVHDIRSHMARGSVYIVPLLVGGGTRIKIFEAMAAAKAEL